MSAFLVSPRTINLIATFFTSGPGERMARPPILAKRLWKDFVLAWKTLTPVLRVVLNLFKDVFDALGFMTTGVEGNSAAVTVLANVVEKLLIAWLAWMAVKKTVQITQNVVQTGKTPSQLIEHLFELVGPHYYERIDTDFPEDRRASESGRWFASRPC